MKIFLMLLMSVVLSGCLKVPPGAKPVTGFDLNQYLGVWYEVARLDHRFERGLNNVTAEYSMRPGGGVTVKNRGFMVKHNEWRDAEGKASFVKEPNLGHLKVSFFPPFYGSYVIFELDPDYQYAFVCGDDTSYLWLLSRTPVLDQEILDDFENKVQALGFDTSKLIYVHHSPTE
ncbi:MAG: lipocalin family protein [Candidatus Marinimicrobia bacterium]|nr:lipocalin family protein [Candidatus Neomarinimicrobiota bacterium]